MRTQKLVRSCQGAEHQSLMPTPANVKEHRSDSEQCSVLGSRSRGVRSGRV